MSTVAHSANQRWDNYHRTRGFDVADAYAFRADPRPHPDGPTRFAETGAVLRDHIAALAGTASAGVLGSAWSLSDLVGGPDRILATLELDGISWVEANHLHHRSRLKPREAVFVGGGAPWQALVEEIERDPHNPRSITTCGSYLQQTIAGSVATATAGSRLGYGGVQNQVRGLHLATGRGTTWIESASDPVIGHVAVDMADEVIRDDAVFEDALVHLGGMGVVNGLVIETAPKELFTVTRVTKAVDAAWLARLAAGDHAGVARWLGHDAEPVYYEVQIDPFGLLTSPALHTMYFRGESALSALPPARALRVNDALVSLGAKFGTGLAATTVPLGRCPDLDCADPAKALLDLFRYYSCCHFEDVASSGPQSWGGIHAAPPAPDQQGVVFSAAFAVERRMIAAALQAICAAAAGRPRHFLYTLRFVTGAAGTLAFQSFPESVVIDFEGLKIAPSIERETAISLGLAHGALARAGVPFRAHWGKLGSPDAAKVAADFGDAADPASPAGRWRATRARLLTGRDADLLSNAALVRWGLA